MLCDSIEKWDGMGDGGEFQEGRGIYMPMTDLCQCLAETSTIL